MANEALALVAEGIAELTRQVTTPPAPWHYGRDLVCISDLTPTLEETDPLSYASLAQDLYHRITTTRGTIVDDPDFGDNVEDYLSAAIDAASLTLIGGRLASECRKDDRVDTIDVEVTGDTRELNVVLIVTPRDSRIDSFEMVLSVTSAGAVLKAIS